MLSRTGSQLFLLGDTKIHLKMPSEIEVDFKDTCGLNLTHEWAIHQELEEAQGTSSFPFLPQFPFMVEFLAHLQGAYFVLHLPACLPCFLTLLSRSQKSCSAWCSLSPCRAEPLTSPGSLGPPEGQLSLTRYPLLEQPYSVPWETPRVRSISQGQERNSKRQFGTHWIFTWIT